MKVLLALAAFLLALAATAQPYNKAVGIKFPVGTGITYKKFISNKTALELQGITARESFMVDGLYEFHFPIEKATGLSWYVGPGVHAGFYKSEFQKNYSSKFDLGVDGVLGLDYKVTGLPINLSLDWQPTFTFTGNSGAHGAYGGIAVRYTL